MNTRVLLITLLLITNLFFCEGALAKSSEQEEPDYDLIVVGSDPEGIAAAISGARNGLSTLMIDTRSQVGGLMTQGWLNVIDMNMAPSNIGPRLDILNKGIFLEFYRQMGSNTFDVKHAQDIFDQMLAEEDDLELKLGVKSYAPVLAYKDGKPVVQGVKVEEAGNKSTTYTCQRVIDATQDANLAAAAGVPFSVGQEDYGYPERKMATTLVFKLAGVTQEDWDEIHTLLNEDDDWFTGASHISAWGFGEVMADYRPTSSRIGVRGLNIGRQKDGTVLINALHIYDVDSVNANSRSEARLLAEKELPRLTQYIKENVTGFEHCYLEGAAPELYIRESRHIYGEYRLTIDDVLENRDFSDRIAFGSYAVDVQAWDQQNKGIVMGTPAQYAIPFRCLVPQKVDNLLVVGRSASFDSLPHGSARVIPIGMATGQAAGVAAALSIDSEVDFRQLANQKTLIYQLQELLNDQGMDIESFSAAKPAVSSHWAYDALKFVRKHALVNGGYENKYELDQVITRQEFLSILDGLVHLYGVKVPAGLDVGEMGDQLLTDKKAAQVLAAYAGLPREEAYTTIFNKYKGSQLEKNIEEQEGKLTRAAAYTLLKDFTQKYKTKE